MHFYVGLHQPSDAQHFDRAFISINRLRRRKSPFKVDRWIMDSGAFTEISTHGRYRTSVEQYISDASGWLWNGTLEAVVAQDYMCEPFILEKTGLSIGEHQRLTVDRYDRMMHHGLPFYVLPVLQGYAPEDYIRHLDMYDERLAPGQYVGVGSVCKRNAKPDEARAVFSLIEAHRPDLRLHGFGLKKTALADPAIRRMLWSADSMAWSFAARREGRNANDWREAKRFERSIQALLN